MPKCRELDCPAPVGLCLERVNSEHEKCEHWIKANPGLELDKLVATKVLGWYQDSDIGGERDWWYMSGKEDELDEPSLYLNSFSTDIRAAWDLAEKFRLCVVPWKRGWTAVKEGKILVDGDTNMAPTAPHAICLAALNLTRPRE